MNRVSRLALRLSLLVAIATAVSVFHGPLSGSDSPYISALSDVALGTPALAAKPCRHNRCILNYNICGATPNPINCVIAKHSTSCIGSAPCS